MSPTTYTEYGVRCSIGELVVREFDNTWMFEVYERMLPTMGVQVLPSDPVRTLSSVLRAARFIAQNAHHQMDADSPDRHTSLNPWALAVQTDSPDRFL